MTTYETDFNDLCELFGVSFEEKEIVAINPPYSE